MVDHSYVALRKEEHEFYEEVKAIIDGMRPLSSSESKTLVDNAFAASKEQDIKGIGLAREMGMTCKEYKTLDAELDEAQERFKSETRDKEHAGITIDQQFDYVSGRTSSEQNKIIYEHARACRKCLKMVFVEDVITDKRNK